ncbi:TenA family protein (plasmid) [Rhizobium etli 8C-3]|uniref:Aminopyrimidine aminohydrolase n=2 Tax=Rhizobium etli TaxID=29449 RepID=A0A1L5PDZ2_RHIET|nr:TenA family protein [Rhizobium etli 8C-3]
MNDMRQSLSDQIIRENRSVFEAMVGHRFVEDIKAGRLSKEVFDRYLVYEGAFVETAISIFALATARAETIAQKRWLIDVLHVLANQQLAYFEKTFAARGIDPAAFDVDRPEVANFCNGMLEIARSGSFHDTIAAMFAAEWMYWTWSSEAAEFRIDDPLLKEWVDLHAHEGFAAQARWLKAELDLAADRLDRAERSRLSSVFGRVQQLEIDFHDAAYR